MSFTLFVASDRRRRDLLCPGSALCTEFLADVPKNTVEVVDCGVRGFVRPAWLTGTPTLLDNEEHKRWTGHAAVQRLYRLALHHASGASTRAPVSGASGPSSSASARRVVAEEEEDEGDPSIWESNVVEEEEEERTDRKMTSDDMARALQAVRPMQQASPDVGKAPPPPPVLRD